MEAWKRNKRRYNYFLKCIKHFCLTLHTASKFQLTYQVLMHKKYRKSNRRKLSNSVGGRGWGMIYQTLYSKHEQVDLNSESAVNKPDALSIGL